MKTVAQITDEIIIKNSRIFIESIIRQALSDMLEECAKRCESFIPACEHHNVCHKIDAENIRNIEIK